MSLLRHLRRAQAAVLAVQTQAIQVKLQQHQMNKAPTPTTEPGKQVFEDVPSTYWAYSYIMDL